MMNIFKKKEQKTDIQIWLGEDLDFMDLTDRMAPAKIQENVDHMQFGNNYARTIAIIDYPSTVKGNWLAKLYRFKGNISISIHHKPVSAGKMIDHVSKSIQELEVRLDSNTNPKRKENDQNKLNSARKLLRKLMEGDNNHIYHIYTYIHLQATSKEELESLTKKINNTLWTVGLKPHVTQDKMMDAFDSAIPLKMNKLPEFTYRNMDAEAASSMFPYDESEIFHSKGIIKGRNLTTSSLVIVDPFSLKNQNEFVVGASGAGKSFYMKKDMLRHFKDSYKIFIIDPEREYSDLIKEIGGQVVVISSMAGTIINPLEVMNTDSAADQTDGDIPQSLLHQKISRIKVFLKLIKKDLSPLEAALVEDALVETYNSKGIKWDTDFSKLNSTDFPILEDLYNCIAAKQNDSLRDFLAILKTFVSGSNSLMFNGHTNVNLQSDTISFDLKDLEEESDVQPAAMFNVLSFLWDEITKDRTTLKRLYVDETHIMADPDNPRAMKFLFNIYKRIRKYKGGATSATQQIEDYLSAIEGHRNYGKAIIGNSTSKLILSLEESDIEDLKAKSVIKLSEEEERILGSDKKGEGIYIVGSKRVHIQVDYTPEELRLIDPAAYKEKYGMGA